ncbi:MAG: hypothetical protein F4213_11970 [Boseongicola sp. SB0677_bin_26]|nr:hypothetical protein [Boseongicola sp. SB0665_bin_10]MYG26722.1 hypothetical protein [Boseongicola sp. SB0677_bin_26]
MTTRRALAVAALIALAVPATAKDLAHEWMQYVTKPCYQAVLRASNISPTLWREMMVVEPSLRQTSQRNYRNALTYIDVMNRPSRLRFYSRQVQKCSRNLR